MATEQLRLVLASQSPARLATLHAAGVRPEVMVSGVDESVVTVREPAALALALAELKATTVADQLLAAPSETTPSEAAATLVIGCDSVLEIDGIAYGKPHRPELAVQRWRLMRGRSGTLHTGHFLIKITDGVRVHAAGRSASTVVHFADLADDEIDAYVATGEPLEVAGAFTIDGLAGPFISRIEGDPHNVVGISLPVLREMIIAAGLRWPQLWQRPAVG